MHEELWAGPDLKLQYAEFHLQKMQQSLEGPPRDQTSVALQAAGAIIDTGWQRSFYPHLDAFLSTTRSVPEIIQCCFGEDAATQSKSNKRMSDWFQKQLSSDERGRRRQFKTQFASYYRDFRSRRLSEVRHNIEHRTGVTPARFAIKGLFGDTHTRVAQLSQFPFPKPARLTTRIWHSWLRPTLFSQDGMISRLKGSRDFPHVANTSMLPTTLAPHHLDCVNDRCADNCADHSDHPHSHPIEIN